MAIAAGWKRSTSGVTPAANLAPPAPAGLAHLALRPASQESRSLLPQAGGGAHHVHGRGPERVPLAGVEAEVKHQRGVVTSANAGRATGGVRVVVVGQGRA